MAESASYPTEVQTSGGFRIEVSPDELTVTKVSSPAARLLPYLTSAAFLYAFYVLLSKREPPAALLFALAILLFQYLTMGGQILRCTRESLQVTDVSPFLPNRTLAFTRDDVREIKAGVVSHSRYGSIGGLIFQAGGRQYKMLQGLRGREMQRILEELQRLGFHLSHDAAMPW